VSVPLAAWLSIEGGGGCMPFGWHLFHPVGVMWLRTFSTTFGADEAMNPNEFQGPRGAPTSGVKERRSAIFAVRIGRGIVYAAYAFAALAIVILTIAFFLRLFAANPSTPFVEWVYRVTDRIMQPFRGIFPPASGQEGSVLDVSLLFAMLMYGLLALVLHALISWLNRKLYMLSAAGEWDEYRAAERAAAASRTQSRDRTTT
jgi:uncharacterized protein YggT (Ycf19 family)